MSNLAAAALGNYVDHLLSNEASEAATRANRVEEHCLDIVAAVRVEEALNRGLNLTAVTDTDRKARVARTALRRLAAETRRFCESRSGHDCQPLALSTAAKAEELAELI
jgi:hypothetical protein